MLNGHSPLFRSLRSHWQAKQNKETKTDKLEGRLILTFILLQLSERLIICCDHRSRLADVLHTKKTFQKLIEFSKICRWSINRKHLSKHSQYLKLLIDIDLLESYLRLHGELIAPRVITCQSIFISQFFRGEIFLWTRQYSWSATLLGSIG